MKIQSQRGGILLATLSFIILLATAAASILELTMNSYRLTMRNEMRVEARSVAESELESVYYQFVTNILADLPANTMPDLLSGIADTSIQPRDPSEAFPVTLRTPFLAVHQAQGWRIKRSVSYNQAYDYFSGVIPGSTKYGKVTYITVRIEVLPNTSNYFRDELAVRVGRRMNSINSSIFQYGVFYEGDMELAPGGNITIEGDVAANGSIYAAAQNSSFALTFTGQVRYLAGGYFNKDSLNNTVLRKPGTLVGANDMFLVPPTFSVDQASQLEELLEPENLVGGVDVAEVVERRPDLFPTENDVYRAAILPPPGETDEYPSVADDPTINAQRMYTRAGLRITVNTDGSVVFNKPGDLTDYVADYPGVVVGTANTPFRDAREGRDIQLTTIDMGVLKAALEANYPDDPNLDFNGAIYVNLKESNLTTPRAIKLTNATDILGRAEKGMTVTTNGGVYIQGNYNTASGTLLDGYWNPAMIMGDQVTLLSADWDDDNAGLDKTNRIASTDIEIRAGILTGNTSASAVVASGGVQNLVRYLEMWGGRQVLFNGALGRLFESKTFVANWGQPGLGDVYGSPSGRTFQFDLSLRDHPPGSSPVTTQFSRGNFFVWTL